ncbi:MAG: SPOR domain-containing protein [Deltaproteobacteria bacterium]|nr:SPOR domain-containing protein [Deltaproteobacteria bacterium]
MENGQEGMNKAAGRSREKRRPGGTSLLQPRKEGRSMQWSFVVAGTLLLALVAFISGVRMGKGLTEMRYAGEPSLKAQAKAQKGFPFRFELKEPDSQPGKEAKSSVPESLEKSKEKISEEKLSPPEEKGPTPGAVKVPPQPKAKFTLQVAALTNPEDAREMVNQLRSKGYSAYQVTGSAAAKGILHRVRIGHFQSLEEARQFALAFEKKEKIKPIIASLQ